MHESDPMVVEARYVGGYRVYLRFSDGVAGEADLRSTIFRLGGVFTPLRELSEFARVEFDPEAGTIMWPNGADLAPESLHDLVAAAASRR